MSLRAAIARCGLLAVIAGLLVACAAPAPPPDAKSRADPQVAQTMAVARRAYAQGDFAQAQALYRQALLRARAIDDAALAADAAYNLAVAEVALRNYDAADRWLREAGFDAARASTDTAEPLLLRAKVAYLRGRPAEAAAFADSIIGSGAALPLRRQATILRGQIRAEAGDLDAARADLRAAGQPDAAAPGAPAIAADAKKLEGTIARSEGDPARAAQLFDAEAELLRDAARYRDMGHAFARAADAYLKGGNAALAAQRYFLAARSLDGLGDAQAAKAHLAASIAAAAQAGDEGARARARELLDEISRRAGP